jgi:hypothetical protein
VQWLLQSFACEAIIAAAHQRVYTARQAVDEDEEQFAPDLTNMPEMQDRSSPKIR